MNKKIWIAVVSVFILIIGILIWATRDSESSEEPVKIGILLPLTGPAANHGQDALNAIRLKLAELETSGEPVITVLVEDTQSNST